MKKAAPEGEGIKGSPFKSFLISVLLVLYIIHSDCFTLQLYSNSQCWDIMLMLADESLEKEVPGQLI